MADKKFDLGEYVEVKDRIKLFYELYANGRLTTERVDMLTAPDGKQRVMVHAQAYRTPDDPHPGDGYSWLELPGSTPYTKGSEVENAETSAWGRAIAALGILVDRSIASAQEVESKQVQQEKGSLGWQPSAAPPREGSLLGIAEAAKPPHDFEVRQTPDGPSVGFALKEGRDIVRVLAYGQLAMEIQAFREAVEGKRLTCYGTMTNESWTVGAGTAKERAVPYTRLLCSHLTGPDGLALPMPTDAPSLPLGLVPEAEAELDAIA